MSNHRMFSKRGVSPIIATVLLVILTLVAVGILAAFVIPFVNDSFKNSKECFDVLDKVKFDGDSLYNCYSYNVSGQREGRTGFSVRMDTAEALAFKVTFTSAGRGNTYTIENATVSSEIRMLNNEFGLPLEVPLKGGVRTYVINGTYQRVELAPVLKSGDVCDTRASVVVGECASPEIIAQLVRW